MTGGATRMNCKLVYDENDIVHRQIVHSSDELGEVTAEPRKVNLKNGIIVLYVS